MCKKHVVLILVGLSFTLLGCSNYMNAGSDGNRVYLVKNTSYSGINVPSIDVCDVGGPSGLTNCRPAMK